MGIVSGVKVFLYVSIVSMLAMEVMANTLYIGISYNLDNKKPYVYLKANISQSHPTYINKFRINEAHHGYAGLYLMGLGYLTKVRLVGVIGEALLIDDVIQHMLRVNTPAHMFNDEVLKYK